MLDEEPENAAMVAIPSEEPGEEKFIMGERISQQQNPKQNASKEIPTVLSTQPKSQMVPSITSSHTIPPTQHRNEDVTVHAVTKKFNR